MSFSSDQIQLFSQSKQWQSIYQYKKGKSKIQSTLFFLSPEGGISPLKELEAALKAFQDIHIKYGTLQLPAACAYPARKEILEKHFKIKFPFVACPDLDNWIKRINASEVAITFAGSYNGNPASILGHTFLRFYQDSKSNSSRHELLSHAVGFLAVSPPEDSRALYMVRGLTGQYPGFYQIEPFYMKVGLYNNSESRDLWEQKLNLTKDEVILSLKLLWEYSFNAQIPYYFIDENCSYRILSFLEVIRPDSPLISHLSTVVLPADTVRVLIENGWAVEPPRFKASILRKLNHKLENFNTEELQEFHKAKSSIEDLKKIRSPLVLDALVDYWTHANYRAETRLPKTQAQIMEDTFIQRSENTGMSIPIDDEEIRKKNNLSPPYLAHKTSWTELHAGQKMVSQKNKRNYVKFSYRMGVHSLIDSPDGYDDVAAIEYLGFDVDTNENWKALLVDARAIEPLNQVNKTWSWMAQASLDQNQFYYRSHTYLNMIAGAGGAYALISNKFTDMKFYFLPLAKIEVGEDSMTGLGFESGVHMRNSVHNLLLKYDCIWKHRGLFTTSHVSYANHFKTNHSVVAEFKNKFYSLDKSVTMSELDFNLGYRLHF